MVLHVLVEIGVVGESFTEALVLVGIRQFAEDQQPRDFHEVRIVGKFFQRDAAVAQDALVAVDVGDFAGTAGRVAVSGIECRQAGLTAQARDVDGAFALGTFYHRQGVRCSIDGQFCFS